MPDTPAPDPLAELRENLSALECGATGWPPDGMTVDEALVRSERMAAALSRVLELRDEARAMNVNEMADTISVEWLDAALGRKEPGDGS